MMGKSPLFVFVVLLAATDVVRLAIAVADRMRRDTPDPTKRALKVRRQLTYLMLFIAACVLGALVGVSLPRGGGRVATVFLVDASDSMGAGGKEAP